MKNHGPVSGDALPGSLTLQSVRDKTESGVLGDLLVIPEGLIFLAAPKEATRKVPGEESGVAWASILGGGAFGIGTLPEPWSLILTVAMATVFALTEIRRRHRRRAAQEWRAARRAETIAQQVSEDERCWWLRPGDIERLERTDDAEGTIRVTGRDRTERPIEVKDAFLETVLALFAERQGWQADVAPEKAPTPTANVGLKWRDSELNRDGVLTLTPSALLYIPYERRTSCLFGALALVALCVAVPLVFKMVEAMERGVFVVFAGLIILGALTVLTVMGVFGVLHRKEKAAQRVTRGEEKRPRGTMVFPHGTLTEGVIVRSTLTLRHPNGELHISRYGAGETFQRQLAAVLPVREEPKRL